MTGRMIVDELPATGTMLFRWRSYMPLALLPLFLLSLRDDRPPTPFSFEVLCFAIALSGLCLRALVVGWSPAGTSDRGTTRPTADRLNTLGAYSILRHPLYVANTLIWVGCALLSGTWYLPVIVALLSFIYHERIAAYEELFLLRSFGDRFRAWADEVPAVIPAFSAYRPSGVRFQARKALMRESHGLCAVGTAFLVLDTLEDSARLHRLSVDPRWLVVFVVTLVPFLFVVIAKQSARRMAKS
jgi:protein-S-isoprenylcysteine O-methyltransferase Ste14